MRSLEKGGIMEQILWHFVTEMGKELEIPKADRCSLHSVILLMGCIWISCCYCTDSKCTWYLSIPKC